MGPIVPTSGIGDDVILGNDNHDRLYGNTGNDFLDGGVGNDRLYGQQGDGTVQFEEFPIVSIAWARYSAFIVLYLL